MPRKCANCGGDNIPASLKCRDCGSRDVMLWSVGEPKPNRWDEVGE